MTEGEITKCLIAARAWIGRIAFDVGGQDSELREDLIQEGLLAASIALRSWIADPDVDPGIKMPWLPWIKGPVRHAMANYLRINRPAGLGGMTRQGRARAAGVKTMSLDTGQEPGEYTLHEMIGEAVDPADVLAIDRLADLVAELPQRERRVIRLRYVEGLTLEQTGALVGGITRERVRQIEAKALARLKARFARRGHA